MIQWSLSQWPGKGRRLETANKFVLTDDLCFGDRIVPKGTEVNCYETTNFGFVVWKDANGRLKYAKE